MANPHAVAGADQTLAHPEILSIGPADLKDALAKGIEDFHAIPIHSIFLHLIYPLGGFFLGSLTVGYKVLPLLFPLAAGFALLGPIAALGLYELSRRRERGLDCSWTRAFDVLRSPSRRAIAGIGIVLMISFLAWLAAALVIYRSLFGVLGPDSITQFAREVFNTSTGWALIIVGNGIGFLFALVVLSISVVSFPLLLDRDVGAAAAVMTSVRAMLANPLTMALWGLIVAAALVLGSLPFFAGLAVVLPVLGHATWHLYRKVVRH